MVTKYIGAKNEFDEENITLDLLVKAQMLEIAIHLKVYYSILIIELLNSEHY